MLQDEECGFQPGPGAHRGPWAQWEGRNAVWSEREDTVGTEARAAEEEPMRGMRSQGSRSKWSLRHSFSAKEERSSPTVRGEGETCALGLHRRKSVGNEARTDEGEGWE